MGRYYQFIAINDYPDDPLQSCVRDGYYLESVLRLRYGFEALSPLTNRAATRSAVQRKLRDLTRWRNEDDDLVVLFSGHGSETGWQVFDEFGLGTAELERGWLRDWVEGLRVRHLLLISDACHALGLVRKNASIRSATSYEHLYSRPSRLFLAASGADESAYDGGGSGNSPFMDAILQELWTAQEPTTASGIQQRIQGRVFDDRRAQVPRLRHLVPDMDGELVLWPVGTKPERPTLDLGPLFAGMQESLFEEEHTSEGQQTLFSNDLDQDGYPWEDEPAEEAEQEDSDPMPLASLRAGDVGRGTLVRFARSLTPAILEEITMDYGWDESEEGLVAGLQAEPEHDLGALLEEASDGLGVSTRKALVDHVAARLAHYQGDDAISLHIFLWLISQHKVDWLPERREAVARELVRSDLSHFALLAQGLMGGEEGILDTLDALDVYRNALATWGPFLHWWLLPTPSLMDALERYTPVVANGATRFTATLTLCAWSCGTLHADFDPMHPDWEWADIPSDWRSLILEKLLLREQLVPLMRGLQAAGVPLPDSTGLRRASVEHHLLSMSGVSLEAVARAMPRAAFDRLSEASLTPVIVRSREGSRVGRFGPVDVQVWLDPDLGNPDLDEPDDLRPHIAELVATITRPALVRLFQALDWDETQPVADLREELIADCNELPSVGWLVGHLHRSDLDRVAVEHGFSLDLDRASRRDLNRCVLNWMHGLPPIPVPFDFWIREP